MADIEAGHKWWLRYVVVPLIGGGGIVAVVVALLNRLPEETSCSGGRLDDRVDEVVAGTG